MVPSLTPKCKCYGVGYQLHDQRRNGRIQKENKMTISYLAFPPLSWTFKSEEYINSSLSEEDEDMVAPFHALIINVILEDKEEVKSTYPTIYPCSLDFELDNWSIVEIPVAHKLSK